MRFIQFIRSRQLRHRDAIVTAGCTGMLVFVIGCGGSGGGNGGGNGGGTGGGNVENKILSGTNLDIGIGVTASKSTVASTVPFSILNSVNPATAPTFHRAQTTALTYVPGLKLYSASSVSGKTLTTSFFSDAAGKNSVGKLTVVATETIGSAYTYPVSFHATGAITGGTVPLSADFTIAFSDSKGANTFQGNLTLTKDSIGLTFDMSLDDSGTVGSSGTIKSTYNYNFQSSPVPIATTLTNLTGGPLTKISGTAAVDATVPILGDQSGTGTGVLDLINGNFTLNITGGALQGLVSDFNGGNDTLTVAAGGGFSDVISGASGFSLSSLLTIASTGGTGYLAPALVQGTGNIIVEQTLGDGEMVGYALDSSNRTTGYYWPTPTSAPQALPAPTGGSHTSAHGIATYSGQTVIVGSYDDSTSTVQPCFWIDSAGSVAFQPHTANGTLPYGGEFEGISANGNTIVGFSYSQSFVQSPIAYISGTLYSLASDGRTTNLMARAVDNYNDILGTGEGATPGPGIWPSVSVDTGTNKIDAAFQQLPNTNGIGGAIHAIHISDNGVIVGGDGLKGLYWQRSQGFAPNALSFGTNAGSNGYAVNHAGTQAAGSLFASSPSTTSDMAFWPTLSGSPVDVSQSLGSAANGYQNLAGFFILNDGSLIAIGATTTGSNVAFVYIQKK